MAWNLSKNLNGPDIAADEHLKYRSKLDRHAIAKWEIPDSRLSHDRSGIAVL
jgi:hypothetical protein